MIEYKKKEHLHRSSHEKKKSTRNDFPVLSTEPTLTKRQKAALEKLEQISKKARNREDESKNAIIKAVADATTKVLTETKPLTTLKTKAVSETIVSDIEIPADSAKIDLENEPIQKKRERQRSLVLNLGK
jgi:hypothetical protein